MQRLDTTSASTPPAFLPESSQKDRDPFRLVDISHLQITPNSIWDFTTRQYSRVYLDPSTGYNYVLIKDFRYIYAGMLYRFILHSRAPEVLCIWDDGEICGAVRQDDTFVDTYTYYQLQCHSDIDREGLAQIVVASFLLGDAGYMNRLEGGSLGVVGSVSEAHHYSKNYGSTPLLFEAATPVFALDEAWLNHLEEYAKGHFCLVAITETDDQKEWARPTSDELQAAAEKIAEIPLEQWRLVCAFCEALGASRRFDRQKATFGSRARPDCTIEEIVLNRVTRFQALVCTSSRGASYQKLLDPNSKA